MDSIRQPTFWESKYQGGEPRWDLGQPAPPLVSFFGQTIAPPLGVMVVLGCGQGQDAVFLAERGFAVTAVDFAPSAIAATQALAESRGVSLTLLQENIFDLRETHGDQFDCLFEHTCFCAIPPEQRGDYAELAATILKPGGLLYGIFFTHTREGGPPFGVTPEEIRALFSPYFEIDSLAAIANSIPSRQGEEHWGIFRRK